MTLTINNAPKLDLDRDVLHVWADVPDGGRFPISASRKHLLMSGAWNGVTQWRLSRCAKRKCGQQPRRPLAGKLKFELFVDPTA